MLGPEIFKEDDSSANRHNTENEESDQICNNFLLSLRKRPSNHKRLLHSVLRLVFKKQGLDTNDSKAASCLLVFGLLLDSMQLSSLIFIDLGISEWDRFSAVWMIFHFSRIDYLCAKFKIIEEFMIALFSICIFVSAIWLLLLVLMHLKKNFEALASVLRFFIQILTYFHTAIALSLAISLKYSIKGGLVTEYHSTVRIGFGNFGIILSILGLMSLNATCFLHYKFNYDLRHSLAEKSISSKVSSKIDIYAIIARLTTVLLYVMFSNIGFIFFRAVLVATHCLVLALLYQRIPYYHFSVNFFKALPHIFVVICCLATLISYFIETATFCILSVICLLPLSITIYLRLLKFRIACVKALKIEDCRFCWQFELFIRESLFNPNDSNRILIFDAFDKYFTMTNTQSTRLLLVWFAEYCFNVCDEPKAALIKLGLLPNLKTSIEIEFHEQCLLKDIKKAAFSHKNEYNIVRKFIKFQEITDLDAKVCVLFLNFITNAIKGTSNLNTLERHIVILCENLKNLANMYRKNAILFEESLDMFEFYRSFIDLYFCNSELLAILDLKKKTIFNELTNKEPVNELASQDACFLIISAEDEDFGIIKYMNSQSIKIMDINHIYYANKHVKILFPESLNLFSNKRLNNFKFKAFGNMDYIERNLIVKTGKGYVKEMSLKVTLMLYSRWIFLFTLKPLNTNRELAIITENGLIIEHTQGLPFLLRIKTEILGKSIESICGIDLIEMKINNEKATLFSNISAQFSEIEVMGIVIRIIYFYSSDSEFENNPLASSYHCINKSRYIKSVQALQQSPNINSRAFLVGDEEKIERKMEISQISSSFVSPKLLKMNFILRKKIKLMQIFKIFLMISVFNN